MEPDDRPFLPQSVSQTKELGYTVTASYQAKRESAVKALTAGTAPSDIGEDVCDIEHPHTGDPMKVVIGTP